MKISYEDQPFNEDTLKMIEQANIILDEFASEGYDLTLRQLYYQFVSRGWLKNEEKQYKKLGRVVSAGRIAGLISWHSIIDRIRNLRELPNWNNPKHGLSDLCAEYRIDRWKNQENRLEVWIEKDALIGVIEPICNKFRVPYFSCRGYNSQSEMWRASQRLIDHAENGQYPVILHLGDHDPSGVDMTRDIEDRLTLFGANYSLIRIALNMNQINEYNPPPNPTKLSDKRAAGYIEMFGKHSWELDSMKPQTMSDLLETHILHYLDKDAWKESDIEEDAGEDVLLDLLDQLEE